MPEVLLQPAALDSALTESAVKRQLTSSERQSCKRCCFLLLELEPARHLDQKVFFSSKKWQSRSNAVCKFLKPQPTYYN